jgi:hypothetical protein
VDDDPERLADRAVALLTDEDTRTRMASELRARVGRFYSRAATLEQMARLAGAG